MKYSLIVALAATQVLPSMSVNHGPSFALFPSFLQKSSQSRVDQFKDLLVSNDNYCQVAVEGESIRARCYFEGEQADCENVEEAVANATAEAKKAAEEQINTIQGDLDQCRSSSQLAANAAQQAQEKAEDDLEAVQGDLTTCQSNLGSAQQAQTDAENNLSNSQGQLEQCQTNSASALEQSQGETKTCQAERDGLAGQLATAQQTATSCQSSLTTYPTLQPLIGYTSLAQSIQFAKSYGAFGTGDFTVALWVATLDKNTYFDVIGNRVDGSHGNFFCIRLSGTTGTYTIEIDQSGTNYIALTVGKGLNDGTRHHLAAVRQGNTLSVYLDGTLAATGSSAGIANIQGNQYFTAGRSYAGFNQATLDIYDLIVYKKALTADGVKTLVNGAGCGGFNL